GPEGTVVRLLKTADESTLLHETGHLFLRDMHTLAIQTQNDKAIEDFSIITGWLGVKERGKFSRENEEKFAKGFESYLREGKAPNARLAQIFDRFKQWLLSIYETAKGLKVKPSKEVKSVFDRMLGGYDVAPMLNVRTKIGNRINEIKDTIAKIQAEEQVSQDQADEIEAAINAAKQRLPKAPESLLGWVKRRGGIWDEGSELADRDLPKGVIRKSTQPTISGQAFYNSFDSTVESAIQEGFLQDGADINDLM
ncbi:unnamed protein product, partial [marine sediment metagenome]